MKLKKFFNNSGISILEVVVAILIITIGLVGVMSLVIQNIQAQYINKNILIASGLAQEGLELVRNIRDLNWLTPGNAWDQSIVADGTYTIDYHGRGSIEQTANFVSDALARLYIDSDNLYTHTMTGAPTNFYRLITVSNNTNYLDVKCTIRWQEGSQYHDYTAETYLYNWR
jgi:type II secretory pathway pseudopilin PulG